MTSGQTNPENHTTALRRLAPISNDSTSTTPVMEGPIADRNTQRQYLLDRLGVELSEIPEQSTRACFHSSMATLAHTNFPESLYSDLTAMPGDSSASLFMASTAANADFPGTPFSDLLTIHGGQFTTSGIAPHRLDSSKIYVPYIAGPTRSEVESNAGNRFVALSRHSINTNSIEEVH